MKLTEIIQADVAYMRNVTVHVATIYGTIEIADLTGKHEAIFLQGDDGSAFISAAERLWEESGDVTLHECYLHLAKPYIDCLWN